MSYKEILCEIRKNLAINIRSIAKYSEPTDYNVGRKAAFEDVARMIDDYCYGEKKEQEEK